MPQKLSTSCVVAMLNAILFVFHKYLVDPVQ